MTNLERKAILYLIQQTAKPAVSFNDISLLDSPQFRDGWTQAHVKYLETLEWLLGVHGKPKPEDVKRYARQYKTAQDKRREVQRYNKFRKEIDNV